MKFFELINVEELNTQLNALAVFKSSLSLSLFDKFSEGPLSVSMLAEQTKTNQETLVQLLDCLIALGFLEHTADMEIQLTKTWKNKYFEDSAFSELALLKGGIQSQERWEKITDIAKGVQSNYEDIMFSSGEHLKNYLLSVMETNRDHAMVLAKIISEEIELNHYHKVTDVAGGHGLYLLCVLEQSPDIQPTLMDLEKTLAIFNEIQIDSPAFNQVTQLAIDLRNPINTEEKYDFIMLNDLLHSFGYQDKIMVIERVKAILHDEGTLMVSKFDYQTAGLDVDMALFSMRLHVNSSSGYLEKNEELRGILEACGMEVYRAEKIGTKISYFTKKKGRLIMPTLEKQQSDYRLLEGWSIVGGYLSGFRHMAVLRCALKIGLFESLLSGYNTINDVALKVKASSKGIELLLNCLVSMDIVLKEEQFYSLNPELCEFFDGNHPHHLLAEIENSQVSLNAWLNLDEIVRGNTVSSDDNYGRILFDGNCHKYKGLQAYNRIQSRPIIEHLIANLGGVNQVLDIAGADGYIANLLLQQTQGTHVTIIDLHHALKKCGEIFKHHRDDGRMTLIEGDARTFELNKKFDLVMMTEVTELFKVKDKEEAVSRAYAHTKEGGNLVITKFKFEETDLNVEPLTFFSMKMFVKMNGSYLEYNSELETIFETLNIPFVKHSYGDKTMYICQK